MIMLVLYVGMARYPWLRWLRVPLLTLSTIAAIMAWPMGVIFGFEIEQSQANTLVQSPGMTWTQALRDTRDWSTVFGLGFLAAFGVNCLLDWYFSSSVKKADS